MKLAKLRHFLGLRMNSDVTIHHHTNVFFCTYFVYEDKVNSCTDVLPSRSLNLTKKSLLHLVAILSSLFSIKPSISE